VGQLGLAQGRRPGLRRVLSPDPPMSARM
jgi:hypothetical protein